MSTTKINQNTFKHRDDYEQHGFDHTDRHQL